MPRNSEKYPPSRPRNSEKCPPGPSRPRNRETTLPDHISSKSEIFPNFEKTQKIYFFLLNTVFSSGIEGVWGRGGRVVWTGSNAFDFENPGTALTSYTQDGKMHPRLPTRGFEQEPSDVQSETLSAELSRPYMSWCTDMRQRNHRTMKHNRTGDHRHQSMLV